MEIIGLTLTGGRAPGSQAGGAVQNFERLTLTDVVITDSHTASSSAYGGGAIFNSSGTLTLTNVLVSGNSASAGGGITTAGGSVTLSHTTVAGNSATSSGGGIHNANGTVTLTDGTAVSGNSSAGTGGGIYNLGRLSISSSIVSDNTVSDNGGWAHGGGIFIGSHGSAAVTISNSTLSGNRAIAGPTGTAYGGGIVSFTTTVTISNSTLSGNSTIPHETAANAWGGGIFSSGTTMTLTNVTLWGNSAPASKGGGIWNSGPLTVYNSIVAGSTGGDVVGSYSGSNNLIGGDPKLDDELQNNGGPTQTHALLPGSPAIDAGNNARLPADTLDLDGDGSTTEKIPFDQRGPGFSRTLGSVVDIGAYEASPIVWPPSDQIQVNEPDPPGTPRSQVNPSVAALAGGGFVVAWQGLNDYGPDWEVYARRYYADGSSSGEIPVNTFTNGKENPYSQLNPSVAALGNGFVVAWQDMSQGIFAQRFDASGSRIGGEILVSTTRNYYQQELSVATLGSGFVIAWAGPDVYGNGVYARRFASDGSPIDDNEFLVNTTTDADQYNPSVAALADASFIVAWQSYGQEEDGTLTGVYVQRFDANGSPIFRDPADPDKPIDIQVNTYTHLYQERPSVAALAGGGFVVSWQSHGQDGSLWGVYARRFAADGSPLGSEFQVNTAWTFDSQSAPSVTALADGGFVIAWQSWYQDGYGLGVYARRYDADGLPIGGEFYVPDSGFSQHSPAAAALAGGKLVVAWMDQSLTGGDEIFARLFTLTSTNRAPVAVDDGYTGHVGTPIIVAAPGLLANDSDTDGDAIEVSYLLDADGRTFLPGQAVTLPSGAGLQVDADGSVRFNPVLGWVGTDSFRYVVQDASGQLSQPATVTIDVQETIPATFIVTTALDVDDQGNPIPGSLHAAILAANAHANVAAGPDTIVFNIPGAGVQTIGLQLALPEITDPVIIDGYTQAGASPNTLEIGNNAVLLVELDGSAAGAGASGLTLTSGGSTVRGLAIHSFSGDGILIGGPGANRVEGNFIGLSAAGAAAGNARSGVTIMQSSDNVVGGTTPTVRNVIAANGIEGLVLRYDAAGRPYIYFDNFPAAWSSVNFDTSSTVQTEAINRVAAMASNLDGPGVFIGGAEAAGNAVIGNSIGTAADGTAGDGLTEFGNTGDGVFVVSAAETIIGGNVISGNQRSGVYLRGTTQTVVIGNIIGLEPGVGAGTLGNGGDGVFTDGSGDVIGGPNGIGNVISANGGAGVHLANPGATGNAVWGNRIGTDYEGTGGRGNADAGVLIEGPGNVIGGSAGGTAINPAGYFDFEIDGVVVGGFRLADDIATFASTSKQREYSPGVAQIVTSDSLDNVSVDSSLGNVIAFNGGAGVAVTDPGTGNAISQNAIFANGSLGIDLGEDGVTPNDAGDTDSGPNGLQNYPVLTAVYPAVLSEGLLFSTGRASYEPLSLAFAASGPSFMPVGIGGANTQLPSGFEAVSGWAIDVTLDARPETSYVLEFFDSAASDPSGFGEGQAFVTSDTVTTGPDGHASFTLFVPAQGLLADPPLITATATDPDGNTSEFSRVGNRLPSALDQAVTTAEDEALDFTLLVADPDGDPLAVMIVTGPASGAVVDNGDGTVTYTPAANFNGDDGFTYTVSDGRGGTATATVQVTVTPVNDAPVATIGDVQSAEECVAITFDGSGSADVEVGDVLTYSWDFGDGGTATVPKPTHVYADSGDYTVTLTVSDGTATGTATRSVTVNNVAPSLEDAAFELEENSPRETLVGQVTGTDPAGVHDPLTYSIIGGSGAGLFAIDAQGRITVATDTPLDFETTTSFTLDVQVRDDDGAADTAWDTATVTINLLNRPSITGTVFVDVNGNGLYEANEPGIDGVTFELLDAAGRPVLEGGNPVTAVTSDGGSYLFEDLAPGIYRVHQVQPSGVDDGPELLGSLGGTVLAGDTMELTLARVDATDYIFAEFGRQLTRGDSAAAGFWQNKHGQALIKQGGARLADWLTNFGNVFGNIFLTGPYAGAEGVADFFKDQLFKQKGSKSAGPAKVDARFMAVALSTFFTSRDLAGSDGASAYGFNVTDTGIGTKIVNVGATGAAFGVEDGTDLTILQLLQATNRLTDREDQVSDFAHIYDQNGDRMIDSLESALRVMANEIYALICESGGIA